jgi:hypothetical protein
MFNSFQTNGHVGTGIDIHLSFQSITIQRDVLQMLSAFMIRTDKPENRNSQSAELPSRSCQKLGHFESEDHQAILTQLRYVRIPQF